MMDPYSPASSLTNWNRKVVMEHGIIWMHTISPHTSACIEKINKIQLKQYSKLVHQEKGWIKHLNSSIGEHFYSIVHLIKQIGFLTISENSNLPV